MMRVHVWREGPRTGWVREEDWNTEGFRPRGISGAHIAWTGDVQDAAEAFAVSAALARVAVLDDVRLRCRDAAARECLNAAREEAWSDFQATIDNVENG